MRWFLFAAVTICPGSWLTFGLSLDELNWRTRLALGTALSPVVLAIQLYLLRVVNVDFSTAATVLLFINVLCLIYIWRSLPTVRFGQVSSVFWIGTAICSFLVGLMVVLWTFIPNFRAVSWHALLHTDIVYLITRNPFRLEEPDLANMMLAAPWMDHVYWSISGWLVDLPPTVIYPISNIIWLVIAFVLAYEMAFRGLGLHPSTALLSAGLTFVGTNFVGAMAYLVSGKSEFLGDIRFTPLLGKYFGFETIPFAFALILGLSLACVLVVERNRKTLWLLPPILLVALGFVYPILFPVGCLLVTVTIALLWMPTAGDLRRAQGAGTRLAIAFVVVVLVFLAYLPTITAARAASTFQFHTIEIFRTNLSRSAAALLTFVALGLPVFSRGAIARQRAVLLLISAGFGSISLYLLFALNNLEYKFILSATLFLAPIAAAGVETLLSGSSRSRWIISVVTPLAFVSFYAYLILKTGVQIPDNLSNTPKMIEDSFWLRLDDNEDDSGWTRAVRTRTPENTILVLFSSRIHVGPFANRALFFPGFGDGDAMAGYSVPKDYYLLGQRGYSRNSFYARSQVIHALYKGNSAPQLAQPIKTLLETGRPIAVRFESDDTPALTWLRGNNIGSELYLDSRNIVWFIDRSPSNLLRVSTAVEEANGGTTH